MTDTTSERDGREVYDPHAVQDRWLPVWDELDPFRPADALAASGATSLDMFPYPSGDLHMGHAEAFGFGDVVARYWLGAASTSCTRSAGTLRAAGRERRDQARHGPARMDLREHRDAGGVVPPYAMLLRLVAAAAHVRPRVLPLEPVAVPALLRARPGLPQGGPVNWCPNDQTVLANEQVVDGHCERCGTVVTKKKLTQWYFRITDYADRLLDDMDQLEGAGPSEVLLDAAQLDRPLDGRRRRLRDRGPRRAGHACSRRVPTPCTARRSSSSPPTPTLAAELARRSSARPVRRPTSTRCGRERHRPAGDRPPEDRRVPRGTRSTR